MTFLSSFLVHNTLIYFCIFPFFQPVSRELKAQHSSSIWNPDFLFPLDLYLLPSLMHVSYFIQNPRNTFETTLYSLALCNPYWPTFNPSESLSQNGISGDFKVQHPNNGAYGGSSGNPAPIQQWNFKKCMVFVRLSWHGGKKNIYNAILFTELLNLD